jgi:hypothetical protein
MPHETYLAVKQRLPVHPNPEQLTVDDDDIDPADLSQGAIKELIELLRTYDYDDKGVGNEELFADLGTLRLAALRTALFDDTTPVTQLFELFDSIPLDDFDHFGFREGHELVNDHCPRCFAHVDTFVSNDYGKVTKVADIRHLRRKRIIKHVNACASESMYPELCEELVKRYPSHIRRDPVTGKEYPDGISVGALNIASKRFTSRSAQPVVTCQHDDCKGRPPLMSGMVTLRDHYALHGVWIPNGYMDLNDRKTGKWTPTVAKFPKPVYYTHLRRYVCDPVELVSVAQDLYTKRIVQPTEGVRGYARDPSIIYPAGYMEDAEGYVQDTKYPLTPARGTMVCRDGFCVSCANDERLSITERMYPLNNSTKQGARHSVYCIPRKARRLIELFKTGKQSEGFCAVWRDGKAICLDPACQRNNVSFTCALDWVNHLVAVHRQRFKGRIHDPTPVKLEELTFRDEAELLDYTQSVRKRTYGEANGDDGNDGKDGSDDDYDDYDDQGMDFD